LALFLFDSSAGDSFPVLLPFPLQFALSTVVFDAHGLHKIFVRRGLLRSHFVGLEHSALAPIRNAAFNLSTDLIRHDAGILGLSERPIDSFAHDDDWVDFGVEGAVDWYCFSEHWLLSLNKLQRDGFRPTVKFVGFNAVFDAIAFV
jgi:hypothetical protein